MCSLPVEDAMAMASGSRSLADQADAKMLHKLSQADAHRAAEKARRKQEEAEAADVREDVDRFNAQQQRESDAIQTALKRILAEGPPAGRVEMAQLKAVFEELRQKILHMEKATAAASYYLSAYDIRATTEMGKALKVKVDSAQKEMLPRKSFSFSRRKVMSDKNDGIKAKTGASQVEKLANANEGQAKVQSSILSKAMNIRDKRDETVILTKENATNEDVEISNSSGCTFYLMGKMAAVRLVNLSNCKIFCGPVQGSVYVESLVGCAVMVTSQQIRIHTSKHTQFYLTVRSHPIIEKCSTLHFAPYQFTYADLDRDLAKCELSEIDQPLWKEVKDFGWLKSTPSPNWSILPEDQRMSEKFETH